MDNSYYKSIFYRCCSVVLLLLCLTSATQAQSIAIVATDSLTATNRAIRGAKQIVKQDHSKAEFFLFYLSDNRQLDLSTVDSIKKLKPSLILSIGSAATQYAKENFPANKIVFAAVKYPALSGFVRADGHPTSNITGASLDIPPEIQFRYFTQLIPTLKKVGVLYTEDTEPLIGPSIKVAARLGLELIPIKVNHEREIGQAFDSLARTVDGIWSVADPKLFSPRSTQFILLNALRHGIPFMGFSQHVVESGALFAIDFDYKAIGRQAGHMASRIINGGMIADTEVSAPDIKWFHYNERTAEHLGIVVPEELKAVAKEVYR